MMSKTTAERTAQGNHVEVSLAMSLLDPPELTRQLVALHGARLVGQLAGSRDPKIAYRWARAGSMPGNEALRRLYAAHRLWLQVRSTREHEQAMAWFLAPHPLLAERPPTEVMIEGRFGEVAATASIPLRSPLRRANVSSPSFLRTDSITASWHEASLAPMRDVVTAVVRRFGARATASLAGESNPRIAYRWVRNEGTPPSGETARRLYGLHRVVIALQEFVPDPVVRAWFLAANPSLNERSPLDAACDNELSAVGRAADLFMNALQRTRSI